MAGSRDLRLGGLAADFLARVVGELLSDGWLRIYAGERPAAPDVVPDPDKGQRLLAQLQFASPAFGPPLGGVVVALPFAAIEPSAPSGGRATWFRATTHAGATVLEGSVGERAAALILNNPEIPRGAEVVIERFSYAAQLS